MRIQQLSGFVAGVLCLMMHLEPSHAQRDRLYIGTYTTDGSISRGIYTTLFDRERGIPGEPELAVESVNPSFLAVHPSGKFLFAVNEVSEGPGRGDGHVSAYRIEPDGKLMLINQQASRGGAPCHLNVDATGKFLLVANYMGGNIVVFPIGNDGSLGNPTANLQHAGKSVDAQRQEGPHAHSINLSSDNRFAYAADLGLDAVLIYAFNAEDGTLRAADPPLVKVPAGGGPRHFSIHPDGKLAFTNNEMLATVTAFHRDVQTGALTAYQDISTLPDDWDGRRSTAECLVHPGGRFLYVSNRGHESIAIFHIDQRSGRLRQVAVTQTGGREPRNFFIHPNGLWLIAQNQSSDTVNVFSINQSTGAITPTTHTFEVGRPVCIRMLPGN